MSPLLADQVNGRVIMPPPNPGHLSTSQRLQELKADMYFTEAWTLAALRVPRGTSVPADVYVLRYHRSKRDYAQFRAVLARNIPGRLLDSMRQYGTMPEPVMDRWAYLYGTPDEQLAMYRRMLVNGIHMQVTP